MMVRGLRGTLVGVLAGVVALGAPAIAICAEVAGCVVAPAEHPPCHRSDGVEVSSASLHDCCPEAQALAVEASPGTGRLAPVRLPVDRHALGYPTLRAATGRRPESRAGPPPSLCVTLSSLLI